MVANTKGLLIAGLLLSVIGAALFVISLALLPSVLNVATNNAIVDAVIVDSFKSQRYNDWAGQKSVDNYFKQYYYLWNLTNPNEVLNGKNCNFEKIGPFNYKYEWNNSKVSFSDDGNLINYIQSKSYKWIEGEDSLNPFTVSTTNFNPAYLGLLSTLSKNSITLGMTAEDLLYTLASAPQTKQFLEYLSSDNFTMIAYFYNGPKYFNQQYQLLLSTINNNLTTTPTIYFLEQWSNSTIIPTNGNSSLWDNMLISYGLDSPSGISLQSALEILNPMNQYSLLNSTNGISYWINAVFNGPNSNSYQILEQELGINQAQLTLVMIWWLKGFNDQYTMSQLLKQCEIESIELLGVCQFITTIPLGYKSISQFNITNLPWLEPIEIPIAMGTNLTISTNEAQSNLFNDSIDDSLLTIHGLGLFLEQMSTNSNNFTKWNLTNNDAMTMIGYFLSYIPNTTGYSIKSVQSFYNTSGLIVTRTANEWLWDCQDDLLDYLGIDQQCSFQQNNTIFKPSTVYTGKKDLSLTNQYQQFQEQSTLTIWNGTVNVTGFVENGQMAPLVQDNLPQSLTIFEENILRPLSLVHSSSSSVMGVSTQRYYLPNQSFPIDPVFNNSINGFANLTGLFNGVPIYVSLWDMYGVPIEYSSLYINGLNQTYENAEIPLDLEPITGNTLYYNLKLQINLQIPSNANSLWFSSLGNWTNIFSPTNSNSFGIFYPSLKIGQTATASTNDINLLKQQFKQIQTVKIAPVVVVSIFGGILLIAGLVMAINGFRKTFYNNNQYNGYNIIN
ncbi:hypothetical protein ACTFIT_008632 [Dictyostelium discoideum]|nr:lysosomal integral membrane protein II [Dictyostelium discoideum]